MLLAIYLINLQFLKLLQVFLGWCPQVLHLSWRWLCPSCMKRWKELRVVGDWICSLISFEGILHRGYKPLSEVLIERAIIAIGINWAEATLHIWRPNKSINGKYNHQVFFHKSYHPAPNFPTIQTSSNPFNSGYLQQTSFKRWNKVASRLPPTIPPPSVQSSQRHIRNLTVRWSESPPAPRKIANQQKGPKQNVHPGYI